ncbi:MAG TPA: 16S rRNA (guanine(527)-N(7))-methyltransferase RsmG [Gaiellaceae bacterium]|nr:16S rRNA (guanine(527)-N(7))-methyltransferase RsmG [Gaiellaceae bacterium]
MSHGDRPQPVPDPRLEEWLRRLLETPGLTAIRDPATARRVHLDESLAAVPFIERFPGSVVDVGSGGGAPGVPVAAALPEREVVLLEASRRKCEFLESVARELPNVRVVWGRAEEQAVEAFGAAVAKALAPPPVAAEWCLPLVALGGAAILLVGPSADPGAVARVAAQVGGGEPEEHPGVLVVPKIAPTPPGFPRRPGLARKRPL